MYVGKFLMVLGVGFASNRWPSLIAITFAYSFLLHVHLHLWANAHGRPLNRGEHIRVYLSYIPNIFLLIAIPQLWTGEYQPMFTKLSFFVIPFAFWIAYVLGLIALTELLIARRSKNRSERRIMRTLAWNVDFAAAPNKSFGPAALQVDISVHPSPDSACCVPSCCAKQNCSDAELV